MYKTKLIILQALLIICLLFNKSAIAKCDGIIVNPITSICWDCFFPMSIGPITTFGAGIPDNNTFPSPVCVCPKAGIPLPGIAVGIWEPIGLIDVVKEPFCFVNLGGVNFAGGLSKGNAGSMPIHDLDQNQAFHHVHYYKYPLTLIINIIIDATCLEFSNFDIAYMSEIDPIWNNDELALILNPEPLIFGNLIAQAACAADCAKATASTPFDTLFWCAGCQGSVYPLTGRGLHSNAVQNATLMAEKTLFRMHRQLQLMDTSSPFSICQPMPAPIIKKSQYRLQMVNPVPASSATLGCNPYGRSSLIYESGRIIPGVAENFGYLIWRKRNCCVL